LLTRIRRLLTLKSDVQKEVGDMQRKWEAKYSSLKSSQDSRLRQLDRFESALKTAQDSQKAWKARLVMKSSEIEAHKVSISWFNRAQLNSKQNTIIELQTQITSLKTRMPAGEGTNDPSGLQARLVSAQGLASTYQRRLAQTQAQLDDAEAKLDDARHKVARAEEKWEFRLRELEARLKAAEEATKRAKQGGKERVKELANHIDFLERELEASEKRGIRVDSLGALQRPTSRTSRTSGER
jgi:DNA repair exonuclease SbcCD ATPase subunit